MAASLISAHPFGEAYAAKAGTASGGRWAELQRAARAEIARGLPGPQHEEWRFTPLTALARVGFIPAAAADDVDVTTVPSDVPRIEGATRVVLVNGVYRADLSDTATDIEIASFAPNDATGQIALAELPLVALNTAYVTGGVTIAAKRPTTRTVHLISIGASGSQPLAFHPRIVVTAAAGASLTVVETHIGLPGQPFFANTVIEVDVAEDATVRRYVAVIEDGDAFHIATSGVAVAARGTYESFHLGLGGHRASGTVRQEIHARLNGEAARVQLGGVYALGGESHHDFTTVITHHAPGASSQQLFKGVLDGKSHGVYQGRVQVLQTAQKTDARQLHKALFLTAGPEVDVKPELEIAADDVQCAHGATTGSIDPDHLFFLAARGIDEPTARGLLVEGFVADALSQVSDETARDALQQQVTAWLRKRGGAL